MIPVKGYGRCFGRCGMMKVGDLVQSTNNGAGIGDSWIDAGHLGLIVE